MRQLLLVLVPDAGDAARLSGALRGRGLALFDEALMSAGRGPGERGTAGPPAGLEARNRDLLRLYGCPPNFTGRLDFDGFPAVLEAELAGPVRVGWRELPPGPPLVHVSASFGTTVGFWLQALPGAGVVLAQRSGGEPGRGGALEALLSARVRPPFYVMHLEGGEAALEAALDRLAAWMGSVRAATPSPMETLASDAPGGGGASGAPCASEGRRDGAGGPVPEFRGAGAGPAADPEAEEAVGFRWRPIGEGTMQMESGIDLALCQRRDLEEKSEQLRLMRAEFDRLREHLGRLGKQERRRSQRGEALAARLEAERNWRLRLQREATFQRVARWTGMEALLKEPQAPPPLTEEREAAPLGSRRRWSLSDPRRRKGLLLLREAGGRGASTLPTYEEEVQFAPRASQAREWLAASRAVGGGTRISVILPVHAIHPRVLHSALQSVVDQAYGGWELCVALDGAVGPAAREVVAAFRAEQPGRIHVTEVKGTPGIAVSTNAAVGPATGEYIAFLDHDDRLALDALLRVAECIRAHPDADVIYTDEDKIAPDGTRRGAFHKPGWSPELLLSFNYITHLLVMRRSLFESIGGVREGFEGSQDYDLVLRATERARRVERIARILYHWRQYPGSAAGDPSAKGGLWRESSRRALREAVERRGWSAEISDAAARGTYRVRFEVDPAARVAVLIPTANNFIGLERCVRSLQKFGQGPAFEIVVVSNNSSRREMLELLEDLAGRGGTRVLRQDGPFNFSALNNLAAGQTDAPYLLLLNDDTEALHAGWMTAMLEQAQRPEIGAVGAQLVYPSGLVQHAGITIEKGFLPDHAFRNLEADEGGYHNFNRVSRNCSAVTGACLMVRRTCYLEVGGLDEALAVTFNDVDFCLKLIRAGYRNVYVPHARLMHHESRSRGSDRYGEKHERMQAEMELLRGRWGGDGEPDPWHNPNLEKFRVPQVLDRPERF